MFLGVVSPELGSNVAVWLLTEGLDRWSINRGDNNRHAEFYETEYFA